MNVSFVRTRPTVKVLRDIAAQLARLADAYEIDLAERGIFVRPPVADTSGPEPEVFYTDLEREFVEEWKKKQGRSVEIE